MSPQKRTNSPYRLENFVNWFMDSSIYNGNGAYNAFTKIYNPGPIYPELTAYALSLGSILYNRTNKAVFLDRAKSSAKFMCENFENGVGDFNGNGFFLFDTGILVSGLLDLYNYTGDTKYLTEAEKRLTWMLSNFDGDYFPPVVSHDGSLENRWSQKPSIHLAKLAIPLAKGWKLFGDESCKRIGTRLLDNLAKHQRKDGRFVIDKTSDNTMLHPHCYATEGYLVAGIIWERDDYLNIVRKASQWLANVQNNDGSFYKWLPNTGYHSVTKRIMSRFVKTKVADATAQAIRIWKVLGENHAGIAKAEEFIGFMTNEYGLRNHAREIGFITSIDERVYSWPGFFYIHAMLIEFGDTSKAIEVF